MGEAEFCGLSELLFSTQGHQGQIEKHPEEMQEASTMFFKARREPDVRIETKVRDGMRFHHVDAAKGLNLKIFLPKITCGVWTQNGCKMKKEPIVWAVNGTLVRAREMDRKTILSTTKEEVNLLGFKGIRTPAQDGP